MSFPEFCWIGEVLWMQPKQPWSRETFRELGLCECCGKPLHDRRQVFLEKVQAKKRRAPNSTRDSGLQNRNGKNQAFDRSRDDDIEALVLFVEGKRQVRAPPAAAPRRRAKPKPQPARGDAFEETLAEFAQKLALQARNNGPRVALAPEVKMRLTELCSI